LKIRQDEMTDARTAAGILYAVVGAGGSALRMLKEGGKIGTARQTVIFSSMRLNGWNGWPPGDREKLKEK